MNTVALSEVIAPSGSRAGGDSEYPVFSVTKHSGFIRSDVYFKKQVYSRDLKGYKRVRPGDFAYATIHLDEGSVGIAPQDGLISPMYTIFAADVSRVVPEYLIRFLKSPTALAQYDRLGKGSVHRRRSISLEVLGTVQFPLPSLEEQRRIAAILDRADAVRAKRRQVLAYLGALGRALFELDLLAHAHPLRTFGDVAERITVGVVVRPASYYEKEGVPALRTLNVKVGDIDRSDLVFFSSAANDGPLAKSRLRSGDLVVSRTGNAGTAASVPADLVGANAIDLIVISPNKARAETAYLEMLINSDVGKRMVKGESRGQIQQHFNVGSLKKAVLPIPEVDVQRRIVARVEHVRRKERLARRLLEIDEQLFASLQARAFRGEL
ncbi:restriction endonuclease subunit S [Clavibacter tessellarius]|uniref:restriction endonuclease subunit S n=1 Tax=Clavibacter tessellarius TaxID=31965 RepID=UPI0039E84C7E